MELQPRWLPSCPAAKKELDIYAIPCSSRVFGQFAPCEMWVESVPAYSYTVSHFIQAARVSVSAAGSFCNQRSVAAAARGAGLALPAETTPIAMHLSRLGSIPLYHNLLQNSVPARAQT